jgi:uncharacterized Zn-finger protein
VRPALKSPATGCRKRKAALPPVSRDFPLFKPALPAYGPPNLTGLKQRRKNAMAHAAIPHFQNDRGHEAIEIGATEFQCIGARPPFDHPHVFLDMGDDNEIVCPYCSTLYRYNPELSADETVPADCLWTPAAA